MTVLELEDYAVKNPEITFHDAYKIGSAIIIHTSGHSPGSSCLYYPNSRSIFTGDRITAERGKSVAENFSWTYDHGLQTQSAQKLLELDSEYILNGHGGRWLISNAKNELKRFLEQNGYDRPDIIRLSRRAYVPR